jgi:hypothetical protein
MMVETAAVTDKTWEKRDPISINLKIESDVGLCNVLFNTLS